LQHNVKLSLTYLDLAEAAAAAESQEGKLLVQAAS
jgi:hypothetical protein